MPTLEDLLDHLGIDYADDKVLRNAARALQDAQGYLLSAVGADLPQYLPNDAKAARLVLEYASEFYDERGTSAKSGNARRAMIESMELQLRLELAQAREIAAGTLTEGARQ